MLFKFTKSNLLILKKINHVVNNKNKYKKELFLSIFKEKLMNSKMEYIYILMWSLIGSIFINILSGFIVSALLLYPMIKDILNSKKEMKKGYSNIYFYKNVLTKVEFNFLKNLLDNNYNSFKYLNTDDIEDSILEKLSIKDKLTSREFNLLLETNLGSGYRNKGRFYKKIFTNYFADKDLLTAIFNNKIKEHIKLQDFLEKTDPDIKLFVLLEHFQELFNNFKYDSEVLDSIIKYLSINQKGDLLNLQFREIYEKYFEANIIDILYKEESRTEEENKLMNIIENNLLFKNYIEKELINNFDNLDIKFILKYANLAILFDYKKILEKILNTISLKDLINIIFRNSEIYIGSNIFIFNYLNKLDIENNIYFKKEVVNMVLKNKSLEDIENFEIDFFNLADNLNVDKESLFILKEKFNQNNLIKLEELKDIKIISI